MTRSLFDAESVGSKDSMELGESLFKYTNRSARPLAADVRAVLDGWFARVPPTEKANIRGRIRSGDDGQLLGAFWEMYLDAMFRGLGYEVELHPTLPDTTRHPDYLVKAPDGTSAYVEAVVVGLSDAEQAEQQRLNHMYTAIKKWRIPDFLLDVSVTSVGAADLPMRRVRRAVGHWLDSFTWEGVKDAYKNGGWQAQPRLPVAASGWRLEFSVIPKREALRANPDPLGPHTPSVGGAIDNATPLRRAVTAKSQRYGTLDRPFVIAALHNPPFAAQIRDAASALWGHWTYDGGGFALQPIGAGLPDLLSKPFWRSGEGPRYRRTSAVMVGLGIHPWNLVDEQPQLWLNDAASIPLNLAMPIGTWTNNGGLVEFAQSQVTSADFLNLNSDWLRKD